MSRRAAEILAPIEPRKTPTERLYDLGMAVAQRKPSEPLSKVTLSNANAKGVVHTTVESSGTDVETVGAATEREFDRLRKKYQPEPEPESSVDDIPF